MSRSLHASVAAAWPIEPSTARPTAAPTWRAVFSTPAPTPDCAGGTAPIAADDTAGTSRP